MSSSTSDTSALRVEPFRGGARWLTVGGGLGALFLIVTLIGMLAICPKEASFSYLVAFAYWSGISMASVILLMIFHATHARWMVILRRAVEAMAASVPIFLLLFIPLVFFGMKHVYVWVDPPASLGTGGAAPPGAQARLAEPDGVHRPRRSSTSPSPASWAGGCSVGRRSRIATAARP